jgi:zinc protease
VGDFDPQEVSKLADELFGNWKSPAKYQRLVSVYADIPPMNKTLETPDKANAFFLARENLQLRDDDADYPALELGNYMLGGGFLNSRLSTRIRQKEGLSYGVGTQLSVGSQDKFGYLIGYAIYAPQNRAKLESAFREEIEGVLKDGFSADEVAAAKRGWLDSRKLNRAQDEILVGVLANNLYLDRTMQWSAELEQKLLALTPGEIKDALTRHIDPAKLSIIKAGDFAKAGGK